MEPTEIILLAPVHLSHSRKMRSGLLNPRLCPHQLNKPHQTIKVPHSPGMAHGLARCSVRILQLETYIGVLKMHFLHRHFPRVQAFISGLPGYFCLSSCIAVQVALHCEFTGLSKLAKKACIWPKKTVKKTQKRRK